ncbi:hypothetical protein GJ744_006767 [Endocarpon pusillum]|uniref:Uncharacterized protein n=1 Tax=Endocarpon pusillum TaxID=364733 RepID=A0A8H7A6R9_9EURO|nr:hypothetical protein GJ744_006767 [Endocarpon pusillum]
MMGCVESARAFRQEDSATGGAAGGAALTQGEPLAAAQLHFSLGYSLSALSDAWQSAIWSVVDNSADMT